MSQAAATAGRDDARTAWLVVAGSFLAMFTVFGVAYSFGAFFGPMAREFDAGSGATSAVFSITAGAYFLLGAVSGRAVDRVGPRKVVLFGAVVMSAGLVATAFVDRLWLGYLTYGTGVGIGVACAYVPLLAVVGGWFEHRRGLALGIAVSGIGLGTLTVAPLAGGLVARYGWRTTYVVFAAASLVLLGLASLLLHPPPAGRDDVAVIPVGRATRTRAFRSLYGSGILNALAIYVPFVFLPPFAERGGASAVAAAALVGIIGGASIFGRLLLGLVADRFGAVATYQACFAWMSASYLLWLGSPGYARLVVFAVLFGVGYGGFIALNPSVVAEFFGARGLGGLIGVLYTSAALGSLLGTPIAGIIIDHAGYTPAILFAMTLSAAAFAALLVLDRSGAPVTLPAPRTDR